MGKALAVLALLLGDVNLKNNGTTLGPVTTIDCRGSATCTRSGATGLVTVTVDGGSTGTLPPAAWPIYNDGGTIGCLMASANDAGCLTAADWQAFNAKLTPDGGIYGSFTSDGGIYGSFTSDGGVYGSFTSDGGIYGDATASALSAAAFIPRVVVGPPLPTVQATKAAALLSFLPPCNAVRRTRCKEAPGGVHQ